MWCWEVFWSLGAHKELYKAMALGALVEVLLVVCWKHLKSYNECECVSMLPGPLMPPLVDLLLATWQVRVVPGSFSFPMNPQRTIQNPMMLPGP